VIQSNLQKKVWTYDRRLRSIFITPGKPSSWGYLTLIHDDVRKEAAA
jgi:hypothetical protein